MILDLLFISAWLGLTTIIIWLVSSFLNGFTGGSPQRELITGYGKQICWWTAALWIGLTSLMLVSCCGNPRFNDFRSNLWTRFLLTNLFIVGPTAYYVGSFRQRTLREVENSGQLHFRNHRTFLDVLSFFSFWGSIAFFACSGLAFVSFGYSVEVFTKLVTLSLLLLPICAVSRIVLLVILIIDAVERPKEEWEAANFLKLLNPWSSVFGMRKYYLHILRPEIS